MQFSFRSVSFSKDCLEAVFDFIYNRRVAWFTDSDSYFSVATQLQVIIPFHIFGLNMKTAAPRGYLVSNLLLARMKSTLLEKSTFSHLKINASLSIKSPTLWSKCPIISLHKHPYLTLLTLPKGVVWSYLV